jgi:hypothetical protein
VTFGLFGHLVIYLATLAGTDVIILKIFLPKHLAKRYWRFFAQTTASFAKML